MLPVVLSYCLTCPRWCMAVVSSCIETFS